MLEIREQNPSFWVGNAEASEETVADVNLTTGRIDMDGVTAGLLYTSISLYNGAYMPYDGAKGCNRDVCTIVEGAGTLVESWETQMFREHRDGVVCVDGAAFVERSEPFEEIIGIANFDQCYRAPQQALYTMWFARMDPRAMPMAFDDRVELCNFWAGHNVANGYPCILIKA